MEYRNKLVFFVFILLAILGIYTYFYISKSQTEIGVITKPALEIFQYREIYREGIGWSVIYGEMVLAVFPYYYNNTSYVLLLTELNSDTRFSNIPTNVTLPVKLYNLLTKSVVDERIIVEQTREEFLENKIRDDFIIGLYSHYIDKSGKLIATVQLDVYYYKIIDEEYGWWESGYKGIVVYKIVVDGENITETKTIYYFEGVPPYTIRMTFEGVDKDYMIALSSNQVLLIDEYRNILWSSLHNGRVIAEEAYETNSAVIYTAVFEDGKTDYIVFDKNTKTFTYTFTVDVNIDYGKLYLGFPLFIGGYYEDIVIPILYPSVGFVKGKMINITDPIDVDFGWVKKDKIFGIKIEYNESTDSTETRYKVYNYTFVNNTISIQKIEEGQFVTVFQHVSNWEMIIRKWLGKHIEVIGLPDNYLPILQIPLYFREEWIFPHDPDVIVELFLIDIYNYCRVYIIELFDQYSRSVTNESTNYYEKGINYMFSFNHPRFLLPILIQNTTVIIDKELGGLDFLDSNVTMMLYELVASSTETSYINIVDICKTNETIITNETVIINETNRTQPQPQPGFGIVITAPEMNITMPPYNMTQNVTTTRRTGIQSVIEIIGRNWWIILLAILLLILIAASLRRRSL